MSDETEALRLIIEDCVDTELRWRDPNIPHDPYVTARRIAIEVLQRLEANGIRAIATSYKGGDE